MCSWWRFKCTQTYGSLVTPIPSCCQCHWKHILGNVKQWLRQHNITLKLDDVWQLCEQWFAEITETEWGAVCRHVKNVEQQYWDRRADGAGSWKDTSVFVAVAVVRTVHLQVQKVTQQQMWSASGSAQMVRYKVSRNFSRSYSPRSPVSARLALKIVMQNDKRLCESNLRVNVLSSLHKFCLFCMWWTLWCRFLGWKCRRPGSRNHTGWRNRKQCWANEATFSWIAGWCIQLVWKSECKSWSRWKQQ